MKFVFNKIQQVDPAIGKEPNHETLREASGPIDKIEWGKEEQGPSLPIPKASSQNKPNQQNPKALHPIKSVTDPGLQEIKGNKPLSMWSS